LVDDQFIPAWYVLHTKSRFESVVNDALLKKALEVYLPRTRVRSRRRDRRLMITVPLFPGYLFVRTDLEPLERLEIIKTPGVVRMVGNKDGPLSVPDQTIASLKIMTATDLPVTTGTRFRRGDRVMVVNGPFTGVVGSFILYKGQGRVIVHIEALGQYAGVEVYEDDIEALPKIMA
jgi:transcription elongation factor/antiterminator RfaH